MRVHNFSGIAHCVDPYSVIRDLKRSFGMLFSGFFCVFCFVFPFLLPCYLRLVGGEKLQRQPPAPFFILSYTIQIYMHNDSKQHSFSGLCVALSKSR